ncbi:hypothetical protein BN135_503 [Cronobacter muytjensii 530]|nr:hypothetical protein BN133_1140 [Cronobacter dublinensis 582]
MPVDKLKSVGMLLQSVILGGQGNFPVSKLIMMATIYPPDTLLIIWIGV